MHIAHESHETSGAEPKRNRVLTQWIGFTTATLSILLAWCSAQVGIARTELIASMVDENGANLRYQVASNKYRLLQAHLQQLHALLPEPELMAQTEKELKQLEGQLTSPDSIKLFKSLRLEGKRILGSVMPSKDDMTSFAKMIRRYRQEAESSRKWSEAYQPVIQIYSKTAARMENAQILAEMGIVISSIGLLIRGRFKTACILWVTGVICFAFCIGITLYASYAKNHALHPAETLVHNRSSDYQQFMKDVDNTAEDEKLLRDIESDIEKVYPQ